MYREITRGHVQGSDEESIVSDRVTLVDRILKELENGPATAKEIALALKMPTRQVANTMTNLRTQERIARIGQVPIDGDLFKRCENVYGLPGMPALNASPKPQKRPVSHPDAIAEGAYRIAGRITIKQIKFPSRANRGMVG